MMKTSADGQKIYTRLYLSRPERSHSYDYKFDDPVYEANRLEENKKTISQVAKELRTMRREAIDGFKDLPRENQFDIIAQGKRKIESILRNGSFFEQEIKNLIKRTHRIVDKIYA